MEQVVAYIRKSTKDKNQKYSLESQYKAIEGFCATEGLELIEVFQDIESGTKKDRKGLKECIAYCEKNQKAIVVLRVDRLSRSPSQMFGLLESPKLKIYITELGLQADPMLISMLVLHSKMEIDLLSRRTKEGMRTALEKRRNIDPMYKFGNPRWEKALEKANEVSVKQADERAIRYKAIVISLYQEFGSYNRVAIELNKMDVRTSRGNKWSRQTIKELLIRIRKLDK